MIQFIGLYLFTLKTNGKKCKSEEKKRIFEYIIYILSNLYENRYVATVGCRYGALFHLLLYAEDKDEKGYFSEGCLALWLLIL